MASSILHPPAHLPPSVALQLSQQAPALLSKTPSSIAPYSLSSVYAAPETPELWTTYENLMLSCLRTGDKQSARVCLDRLLSRFGGSNERIMALQGLYREATAENDTELQKVLTEYNAILKTDPGNMPVSKRRIALLKSMGKQVEAISALVEFLDCSPTDAEAWAELSDLYASQGLYQQSIFALEEVLLITPNAWNIHARLGELLFTSTGNDGSTGKENTTEKYLVESVRRFSRSIELCDDYLRGFYGLKLATSRALLTLSEGSNKSKADSTPSLKTIQSLNLLATAKLTEIVRRSVARETGWEGYDAAELIAARELLDRDAVKTIHDTWDPIYSEDADQSEPASRSRQQQPIYRDSSQPAPSIRRSSSRRQASSSDHSSRHQQPRAHRPRPNPASSVASIEDYPGYGRGYPPQNPQYVGRAPPPPAGYPQSFASGYAGAGPPPPFPGAAGSVVPFGPPPSSHGYPQNPFSPAAGGGQHGYYPPGQHYPTGQQPPGAFGGHEMMPYGQAPPYGGYPQYGVPHQGQGTSGSQSPYYHYSQPVPPPHESPAPTPAPAPAPATPAPPPAPVPDPEVEKKFAELERALQESRKLLNDKVAAEQKAKDDAEHAAATSKKVAEEVAKMKATMEEAARAKEVADAKAKFDAEVAAVQKVKDDAEKAKVEAEAKKKYEADLKAKFEEEIKVAKAAADAAKAEADAKNKYEADLKAKFEEEIKAAKAEVDAAKALAAPPKDEKKKPIKFKDAVGRKFSFPYHLCQTWAGMEDLIRQAFLHVEVIGPHVQEGHYDLIGPNGEIILPQVWETMIEPDWAITMHMWPMPEPPKPQPGPPPVPVPQPHGKRHSQKAPPRRRDGPPPPPPDGGYSGLGPGGMPAGVMMVEENVPKKKKNEKSSWSLFGSGGSKPAKSGKGRAKKG
ncbi:hypothetical protein VE00_03984 [Pseudogymnoascus sp. WSF 3629]|nr:hypothetical protein VE00_03984 [Pseudogymnoascus sp. WSF 3629]